MMTRDISNQVGYYYDSHQTEEDKQGQTTWHSRLVSYLWDVLRWQFQGQSGTIYKNLNFYQTLDRMEYPIAPDLAVLKGIAFEYVRSWTVGRSGPAPNVTFEILAEETWKKDMREKPWKYASMGVQEYFAYDPHEPPISQATARRLSGWRLDTKRKEMVELIPDARGWLWSEQLESWLVPDGIHLRLYDREHQMRLTTVEAYTKLAVECSRQVDEVVRRTEEARRPQEAIKRAEEEARRAQEATKRAEEEARRAQALAEKLRTLGIDPDEVV
jgi:Uma2 family endonuclease